MEDEDIEVTTDDADEESTPSTGASASTDRTDPDVVVGKPTKSWVWLAPDWSDYGDTQKEKTWTRVQIETTDYQDGRSITRVLDARQRPIQHQVLEESVDPKVRAAFDRAVKNATASKPAPPTRVVRGADGQNHIMERNPATGAYDIDRGLASSQPPKPPAEKPKPSEGAKWQPLKTPDGRVVALVDPSTGDTVSVTQKDPQKPHVFETKDGRIITVGPDGTGATDVTPDGPADKPVPAGLEYAPNYDEDDGGLSDYNNRLMDARRAGIINRQQGLALLQQAGAIWEGTVAHGGKRRDQALTQRSQDVSQRGQTLDEVASRRTSADGQYKDVGSMVDKIAEGLIPADGVSGKTVVDAYRAMLGSARDHVEAAGGYREIPEIGAAGMAPIPGSESTQVVMHPGGRIEVSPAGAAPPSAVGPVSAGVTATTAAAADPTGANVQAANDATMQGSQAAFEGLGVPAAPAAPAPVNPPAGEPGNDPTQPVGLFDPRSKIESLVAMGFDPEEAENVVSLYARGVRGDQL